MKKFLFPFSRTLLSLLPAIFLTGPAYTQQLKPVLERNITVRFTNERTDVALNTLSQLGNFSFSYNPAILDPAKPVTGNFESQPLREVLNAMFKGGIEYRERKGYLILQKAKPATEPAGKQESFVFSGYVRDGNGVLLSQVSIYDRVSLESTLSNEYGYYRIRFAEKHLPLTLYFSKQGYFDTSVAVTPTSPSFLNMNLNRIPRVTQPAVSIDSLVSAAEGNVGTFFSRLNDQPNTRNITDTIYRKYQVSLLPYIGTNMKMSANVINDYSFNVLGGISHGTRKAEVSGLININKSNVRYVQLAGFANVSGGQVKGLQVAGFSNLVRHDVSGVQLSGFSNLDIGNATGLMMAGFVNTIRGKSNGVLVAGFVNTTIDSVTGFQLAGFANVANRSMSGTQLSGFANVVIDTLKGTQVGFVNYAKHVKGSQIGFLNVAHATTGVPVGFLSYVHKGYHKIEVSVDEIFPVNAALRTGVTSFHNMLFAAMNPFSGDTMQWNFGYGIGTSALLGKRFLLDFDLTSAQVVAGNSVEKINLLNKAYVGLDFRLSNRLSFIAGVSVNTHIFKTNYSGYPDIYSWYEPNIFYEHTWELDHTHMNMWLGGKVGLRFF